MQTRVLPASAAGSLVKLVPALNSERVKRAADFASELYAGRELELMNGVSLFQHAAETAEFLAEFCHDEDALIATLLQHALKAPEGSLEDIRKEFGRDVRDIVSRVHLLSHLYATDWRKSVDDMRIMLVSVSDDMRVLLIALSVSCMFMERLESLKPEYRVRLCRQSLQLFAPVAARLGIYALKYRLERSAFPECYPSDSQLIGRQLTVLHLDHGEFIHTSASAVRSFLAEQGIHIDVMAREKQPYSIFQKMRTKSVSSLEKITDLFAIRVLVPSVEDCYQALGLLHRLGTPISHRFKDYISFPKPNGYQSLHTCVLGLPGAPKDVMVEVQIRTKDMHREAEYGVAAHWMYKHEGKGKVLRGAQQFQLADVLMKQQSLEALETGGDLRLVDHIYVLTPRGDILELPDGGTPLDFAFLVHTDLGLRFKAARVNGAVVPISYTLENGDVVEILTHKHPRPSLQWLEELVTPSARSKLKNYFFSHNRPQFLTKGRDILNAELKTRGLPGLDTELHLLSEFDGKQLSVKEREDLLVKVGMGSVRTSSVLRHAALSVPVKIQKPAKASTKAKKLGALVTMEQEMLGMPYRFAKCCAADTANPRPEKIVGIVTRTGIVSIHKDGCGMVKGGNPERRVKVRWAD